MTFDESNAKSVIRALLDMANGAVAEFVPTADVLARCGPGADATLEDLIARRWIRAQGNYIAATKWAIEFGMDWTNVPAVLRAILNTAGGIGRVADLEVVITASGLERREVEKILTELSMLDLGAATYDGGAYVRARGWDYLTTGIYKPSSDRFDDPAVRGLEA